MRRFKQETYTSQALRILRECDDFMTHAQLREKIGQNIHNALRELQIYKVIDCVQQGGKLWWFALPQESDTRSKVIDERTPEIKPRQLKRRVQR